MLADVGDHLLGALGTTLTQLLWLLGPAAACALALHQLERLTGAALAGTFGWRSVLVTGWIGVPVHELSHVIACLVFMHELEEVKLFDPDPEAGTLGYVRHSAPAANPWAEVGRFFIGVAPLLGGGVALYTAARLLLPGAELGGLTAHDASLPVTQLAPLAFARGAHAASAILSLDHVTEPRFWLFLYLALCVGAHLAPSARDLRGALRGAVALFVLGFLVNLVASAFGGIPSSVIRGAVGLVAPVTALLVLATALSAVMLVLVLVVTSLVERARGARGHALRFLVSHGARLALIAIAIGAFAAAVALT